MTTDSEILSALRRAGGGSVSATELGQELGLSRAAIWARIAELRRLGYDIPSSPHCGYRLAATPDRLHADDLISRLGETRVVGRDVRVFKETSSTNDLAEKLARDGVPEGVVVFAESQTRGRGRLGRTWFSPPGKGLWFSALLRPRLRPQETTRLTVAAATALVRAMETQTGLAPEIKWPNDILVCGRKVAGILTELSAEPDQVRHVVLGIGIDVNVEREDFPTQVRRVATSLRIETGRVMDRPELAACVLRELDLAYERIVSGEFESVANEWEARCTTLGRVVVVATGERRLRGLAEALDADGALLLRTEHGHLERVIGGDVLVEK